MMKNFILVFVLALSNKDCYGIERPSASVPFVRKSVSSSQIKNTRKHNDKNTYNNNNNRSVSVISSPSPVSKRLTELKGGSSEGSSIAASVFNLVNNVAGAGILTLAAGKALGTGWIPSVLICTVLGAISCYTFSIVGFSCEITKQKDFKGLWAVTLGEKSTYVVDLMISILCIACSVIYSGILGDVFTPLFDKAGLPAKYNIRNQNIIFLTATILLPLSLVKDLSALAFTSILGFSAIAYTVFFIVVRSLDGTYSLSSDSAKFLVDNIIAKPSFDKSTMWNFDFTSLVLASNLGLAYIAHYNAPIFYRSLKNTNSKRFSKMVGISFTILTCLYIVTMCTGYSTFGDTTMGNILLNYHPNDFLGTLARLATGFSILFGFPLVLTGARESIIGATSSLGFDSIGSDKNHFALVSSILLFVTTMAVTVDDVSLVVGLTGALLGSFIVYICPGIIYAKTLEKFETGENSLKKAMSLSLIPFGLFIGGLGSYMTLKEANLV